MLAEAAPTHLCTHSGACFAKRPIKASEDAWKGLRANRVRTVMIGVGAAQGGAGVSGPRARRECVRAQGERAARAQSVHDTQAARLRSLSVGPSPIWRLKVPGGGEDPTKLHVVDQRQGCPAPEHFGHFAPFAGFWRELRLA